MFSQKIDNEIRLTLVQESFAPALAELARDNYAYLEKWLVWPPHSKSEQDFVAFIRHSLHGYADGKSMVCAILYHGDLVGVASFNSIDHKLKKVEIGYWLAESMQGKGIITRVCQKLMHIAFEELGMHKVEISAATSNKASRAVCERLGMTLEGVIGRNFDLILPESYGEVISGAEREYEYTKIKSKLERDGLQKDQFQLLLTLAKEGRLKPSVGAGLGIERFIRYVCGTKHVAEVQVFPRIPGIVTEL